MASGNWCLIESDPGVFTELINRMGVQDAQVDELLDMDMLPSMQLPIHPRLAADPGAVCRPVHGLIFLFKYSGKVEADPCVDYTVPDLFFAHQVITNACATQAILSILLNATDLDIGEELSSFKEFTKDLPPDVRGEAINNSESIRTIHNSFARQEQFSMEKRVAQEDDDVFHFVAYVPHDGRLYELDGLRKGPIDHGACSREEWLSTAVPVIQKRMEKYAGGEIRFNLLAVRGSVMAQAQERMEEIQAQLLSIGQESEAAAVLVGELEDCKATIAEEERKREQYRVENARRKHNYIPLFLELMTGLARRGKLKPLLAEAQEKAKQRASERAAGK